MSETKFNLTKIRWTRRQLPEWFLISLVLFGATIACRVFSGTVNEETGAPTEQLSSEERVPPTTAPTETSIPRPDQIAFWSDRDGDWEIFVIDADGSNLRKVATDATYKYTAPAWSPDGAQIAYVSSYASGSNLMVVDVATGMVRQLSSGMALLDCATWNPAGTQLVFSASTDTGSEEIFIVNTDGSSLTNLTNSENSDWRPVWSPDGEWVAYQSLIGDEWEILLQQPGSTEIINVTAGIDIWGTNPAWSPDGSRILFHNGSGSAGEIYIINLDGSGLLNLSNSTADDTDGWWSPTGDWVLFYSDRDGNEEVYIVRPDGSDLENLTQQPGTDWMASWSPDEQHIAYVRSENDTLVIYVMDADGENPHILTQPGVKSTYPAWRPDGN